MYGESQERTKTCTKTPFIAITFSGGILIPTHPMILATIYKPLAIIYIHCSQDFCHFPSGSKGAVTDDFPSSMESCSSATGFYFFRPQPQNEHSENPIDHYQGHQWDWKHLKLIIICR